MIPGGCGDAKCCVSSGLSEELTFGKGKLDFYGYWSDPCPACARAFEKVNPDMAAEFGCWPFDYDNILGEGI